MNLVIGNISHFLETDRLHCGKEWVDMEGLGWYDNTARFHDAILCRFTTPDPLAEQYPDLSPYAYCMGNPIKFIDPTGMEMWSTNNYDAICSFMEQYEAGCAEINMTGWEYYQEGEYTLDTEKKKIYHTSWHVNDGVFTLESKSYDLTIYPDYNPTYTP